MKRPSNVLRRASSLTWLGLLLYGFASPIVAAPITSLFSTGLDAEGKPLAPQTQDPHYRLVRIPDPTDPTAEGIETNAPTFTLKPGFPVGPWLAESTTSRWIAPQADQSTGSDPGDFTYRTSFDLTGFDPNTAKITGRWTSDNGGMDVLLNGSSLGISQGGSFGGFYDFEISTGFVEGTNVLEFVIQNAPPGINPTGLRVEFTRATAEKPGDPPAFLSHPTSALALVGDSLGFSAEVDGTRPMTFQWQRDGRDVTGATDNTYTIPSATLAQAGDYVLIASNAYASRTSNVATLRVLEPVPGVFATGVDSSGNALDDYSTDTHYQLLTNPNGPTTEPIVHDSTVFPIVSGPWVANTAQSKWIAPDGETSAAAAGDYVYRLTFTLPNEFDASTAVLFGAWATDNDGLDILVNGASTGNRNTTQFAALTPFEIRQGLVAGINTVDFKVNNASAGYTALRVDPLRLGALRGTGCRLRFAAQPASITAFAGDAVVLSAVADGCPPLRYQWKRDGQDLPGRTLASLDLGTINNSLSGEYAIVVTDSTGATLTSEPARVSVLDPIPGLFDTGVNADGLAAEDGGNDLHYFLVANPHDSTSTNAIVEDSTGFPIVAGPWIANTDRSKWIGPVLNTVAAPGEYIYRTSFVLPAEFDPASVRVEGFWTSDNNAPDILVNGRSTGITITGDFAVLTRFVLTNLFQAGTNTLDFKVANAGTEANPTGLRIQNLRGDAIKGAPSAPPTLGIASANSQVQLSWPTTATGFRLHSASSVTGATWVPVNAPVKIEGDRNTVTLSPSASAEFFRLQK